MLFSATFSEDIRHLADRLLNAPVTVEIAANRDVSAIRQTIYQVAKEHKRDFLRDLIVDNQWRQVLVFTKLKSGAARLAKHLEKDGFTVDCIHGDRTQSARSKALAKFKAGDIQILVATDVVARGIDIKELPHVVNFDLPNNAEDYVHRIGRTGRAGMDGEAVSLMQPDDRYRLRAIERLIKRKFDVQVIDEAPEESFVDEAPEQESKRVKPKNNARALKEERTSSKGFKDSRSRRAERKDTIESPYVRNARRTEERRSQSPKRLKKDLGEFDYILPDFD